MSLRTSFIICLAWTTSLAGVAHATALSFTEVTTNAGINHLYTMPTTGGNTESRWMTGGAVAEDFNGDGWIDLYVLQCGTSSNLLYMNRGDGTFTNEASTRGAEIRNQSVGAAAADYDNDGDIDIAVSSLTNTINDETGIELTNGTLVLINDGTGNFTRTDLTLFTHEGEQRFQSMSFGDVDNDGLLELAMAQWYGNRRSLFFFKGTNLQQAQLFNPADQNFSVFSPAFADFNGDRRVDVAVVSDFSNSHLYVNSGLTGTNTLVRADDDSTKRRDKQPPVKAPAIKGRPVRPDEWKLRDRGLDAGGGVAGGFDAKNITLLSWLPLAELPGGNSTFAADCWGYTSPSGREYAIIGIERGTAFVEVTDPVNPVITGFVAGSTSLWHDVTVIGDYAYACSDQSGPGVQIIDLRQIDSGIVKFVKNWAPNGLSTIHTIISNPETKHLFLNSSNIANGGLICVDATDPENLVLKGAWTDQYMHEAQAQSYTEGPYAGKEIASGDHRG